MKNYSEIYVSLREEIMQEIWNLEDFIKTEFDVSSFTELNNPPDLYGDAWNCKTGNLTLDTIHITDICVDKVVGYYENDDRCETYFFALNQFITDSLIEIYETLCEYEKQTM